MSAKSPEERELWEFGGFRLDGRARLLLKDGVPVPLTPKALDVLLHLARNEGRVVTREELLDVVWPDTIVTDASLTQAVFLVRKALGDPDAEPFVETVPKSGYRLHLRSGRRALADDAAPSSPGGPQPAEPPDGSEAGPEPRPAAVRRRLSPVFAGLVAAGLVAAASVALILLRSPVTGDAAPAGALHGEPLLALEREVAVPPDALDVLGAADGAVVLSAPSAFYLLPADGALAASRVALGAGEVLATPLAGGRLLVLRGGRVVSREPAKPGETDLGPLPADAPRAVEGRVRVSRSGRFLALRGEEALELFERGDRGWARRIRARVPFVDGEVLEVGERLVALARGGGSAVLSWSLPDGAQVLDAPFAERRVFAVAVDDAKGEVAVGGPFDTVAVFSTTGPAGPRLLPRRGWTYGLAYVSDVPTLLASGQDGMTAFRDAGQVARLATVSPGGPLRVDSDFVLALVPKRQRLSIATYAGIAPSARVPAGGHPLWSAEHDAAGATVFSGGRDGHLWTLDTRTLSIRSDDAHTDGIPSLVRDGELLASSSDDKTVALWGLPGPTLRLRSKVHDFLVNDLAIVEGETGRELVTSSSDGTVRRWAWPSLDLLETVDVTRLLGRNVSLHAVWAAPGARRVLAGTWSGSLVALESRAGRWSAREHPVPSRAVYRLAPVPRLGLVVVAGILPASLHVFDLASGATRPLETAGLDAFWAVPVPGRDEVLVAALDGVSRYALSAPLPDGAGRRTLTYRVWSGRRTGAGLQTATLLPDGSLWAGTVKGELVRYDARLLEGPPLLTRSVELGPEG